MRAVIQLENAFRVSLPVDKTWALLSDLPRVATCLPGAHLDEVVDGEYRGALSTKIGPITARYRGTASFLEYDEVGHRAVIAARGREEKGSGSATATITATLSPDGDDATKVHVSTEMAISGRVAQFGRSLLAEVSTSLVDEFVRRLEALIHEGAVPGAEPTEAPTRGVPGGSGTTETRTAGGEENNIELMRVVVMPMLRRAAVPGIVALVALVVGVVLGRRRAGPARRTPGVDTGLPARLSQRTQRP